MSHFLKLSFDRNGAFIKKDLVFSEFFLNDLLMLDFAILSFASRLLKI